MFFFIIFHYFCRISNNDGVIRHVFRDDRASPYGRPVPYLYTRKNGRIRSDQHTISDFHDAGNTDGVRDERRIADLRFVSDQGPHMDT